MPIAESDVLKPKSPSVSEDDWPEYMLRDVSVVYESNGKPANLLVAYADTPLKLHGRLGAPSRQGLPNLLKKPYKPTDIVVPNVTRYAYAELVGGAFVIWAEGGAGWFEIQPAAHYKATFDEMMQAVQLLYFVTDIYNEHPRKKGGGPSAKLIYQEYAEDARFPCTDPAEAEQIFVKHRVFLLMAFLKRAHNIGWSNTPLYQALRRQFPEDFETCKARHENRFEDIRPAKTSRTSPSLAPAVATRGTSEKAKAGRSKAADEPPKKDDNWWEAAALFEFMQKAVNQRAMRAGRNSITVDRVAQLIVKHYEIEDMETARNVLLVHAQNLCYMMDHPRRSNARFFAAESIYGELTEGHNLSAVEQRRAEGVELKPRNHRTLREEESESSDTSDEDDAAISTPARRPGRSKKGTLSVLRPRSGKFASKGKSVKIGGKGKTKPTIPVSDSDASESDDAATTTPTQALSPGPLKRRLSTSDEPNEVGKRQRTQSPSSPRSTSPESQSTSTSTSPPLPLRHQPPSTASSNPTLVSTLLSTPLPTYTPNAPRDSWICPLDGCAQRIYGCSRTPGRQLISEHLEDHAKGREKVVGVLWGEEERLRLPVSNLIKKIREMSEKTAGPSLFATPAEVAAVLPRAVQRSAL